MECNICFLSGTNVDVVLDSSNSLQTRCKETTEHHSCYKPLRKARGTSCRPFYGYGYSVFSLCSIRRMARNVRVAIPELEKGTHISLSTSLSDHGTQNLAQPTTQIGPSEPTQLLMPDKKDRDMWWAFLCGKPSSEWIPRRKSKKQKGRAQIDEFGSSMRSWDEEPSEIVFDVAELEQQQPQNDEGEVEQALQLDPAESLPSPRNSPPRIPTTEEGLVPREPTTRVVKLIDEVRAHVRR